MKQLFNTIDQFDDESISIVVSETLDSIFKRIIKLPSTPIIIYIKGYYEDHENDPTLEITVDATMATTFEWLSDTLREVCYLDDIIIEVYEK